MGWCAQLSRAQQHARHEHGRQRASSIIPMKGWKSSGSSRSVRWRITTSTTDDPRWECVDIRAVRDMPEAGNAERCEGNRESEKMALVTSMRLSVQPVTEDEWIEVCRMGPDWTERTLWHSLIFQSEPFEKHVLMLDRHIEPRAISFWPIPVCKRHRMWKFAISPTKPMTSGKTGGRLFNRPAAALLGFRLGGRSGCGALYPRSSKQSKGKTVLDSRRVQPCRHRCHTGGRCKRAGIDIDPFALPPLRSMHRPMA